MNISDNLTIKKELEMIVGADNVFVNEPMNMHTSFKTGGCADFFVVPSSGTQISKLINYCKTKDIDFTLFGNGSNTLVTDKGIRGVVISLKGLNKVEVDRNESSIVVGAGVQIIKLSSIAQEHGLTGLEFACGIPGTVGGAIFMNAGAYGGEFKDIVRCVNYYMPNTGEMKRLSNEDCQFDYRRSVFQSLDNPIIISCIIDLKKGNKDEIKNKMKENMDSRSSKQPINYPSAGSTFKRENGIVVAKLIDEAGLKGYQIGGAQVSNLHAGFIINTGDATSQDILDLIDYVKKTIYEKYNVTLHEEIKIVGER